MKNTYSVVVPVRAGSTRLPNKNTKPFLDFKGGLLELKLKQLAKCKWIDEIIVSTNDPRAIEIACLSDTKCKVIQRPEELCTDETTAEELIKYIGKQVVYDHVMWVHVTSPLMISQDYDLAVLAYEIALQTGNDSLLSVVPIRNFIMNPQGVVLNAPIAGTTRWPRTQDLNEYYQPTHAIFLASRRMHFSKMRVGDSPYLFKTDDFRFVDVDYESDFKKAELIYNHLYGSYPA